MSRLTLSAASINRRRHSRALMLICAMAGTLTFGHEWHREEPPPSGHDLETARAQLLQRWQRTKSPAAAMSHDLRGSFLLATNAGSNSASRLMLGAANIGAQAAPVQAAAFQKFPRLKLRWDQDFLFVESNGLPDHKMMVGITSWQQQVPLPQAYVGDNAWRLPLHPIPADTPVLIKGNFLRGAIAIAANGIPIFNPQNNRGEVSQEIGELDQWGGHCGRADDYHYHAAPLHLEATLGKGMPLAYALDGYPIYGLTEPDGSPVGRLDECHGHDDARLGYHYHASLKYPYVIGGFHGQVVEVDAQVDPQPRAQPMREALRPLHGAEITEFESLSESSHKLVFKVDGDKRSVTWSSNTDGSYAFVFDNGKDGQTTANHTRRGGGGGEGRKRAREPQANRPVSPAAGTRSSTTVPNAAAMLDRNNDGIILAAEYAAEKRLQFEIRGGESLAVVMEKARGEFNLLDRNHDQKLDAAELAPGDKSSPVSSSEESADAPPPSQTSRTNKPARESAASVSAAPPDQPRSSDGTFLLTSSAMEDGKEMPVEYTGDGIGSTLPLDWKGAPAGTKSYTVIMDHMDREGSMKWYWTVYDIPGNVTRLEKNTKGMGRLGTTFKGHMGYEPPHSKGPGAKTYVLTVYALSEPLQITQVPREVNRQVLITAMEGKVLATSSFRVVHTTSQGGERSAIGK